MSKPKTTPASIKKSSCLNEASPKRPRLPMPEILLPKKKKGNALPDARSQAQPDSHESVIPLIPAIAKADPQLVAEVKAQLKAEKEKLAQISRENGAKGGRPTINTTELTKHCLDTEFSSHGQYTLRHYRNNWYLYTDGCYRMIPEKEIDAKVTGCLIRAGIERVSTSLRRDILGNMASDEFCGLTEDKYTMPCFISTGETAVGYAAMKNGIINVNEIAMALKNGSPLPALIPNTPDLFTTVRCSYEYNPAATCPKFMKYLEAVQPNPENRWVLQLLAGLLLSPDTSYEVAFFIFGESGTGKTVFMDVLEALIGKENCCCVPLASFAEKHAITELTTKLANLVDEAPIIPENGRFSDIESVFKAVSSCRPIKVEPKFANPWTARATARCVFTSNNLPTLTDRSNGVWDRMRLIPFNVKIRDTPQQDLHFFDKLKEEMPGILNWALKGRAKLYEYTERAQEKKTFPRCHEGEVLLAKLRKNSDHETTFLRGATQEANQDEYLEALKLYDDYVAWSKRRNYHPIKYDKFRDAVLRLYPNADFKRKTIAPGEKPTVIFGVNKRS